MNEARIAVIVSRFNEEITDGLLQGALGYLSDNGEPVDASDIVEAPGAFETPLLAQKLAKTGRYDGVVCLGCVIKGDTAHFEFISIGAAMGIMTATLQTEVPISFGILTTYSDAQAEIRSRPGAENKGREAAAACLASIKALRAISAD